MDVFNVEAAVKALKPMVNEITASIEGALDRVGATVITVGPITIPAFKIEIEMPSSAHEQ